MPGSDVRVLVGDCRTTLATLEPESIQCACTSPPYFALRDYGLSPTVWGGSSQCDHLWADPLPGKRARWGNVETLSEKQKSNRGSAQNVAAMERAAGRFCQRCQAWCGVLGGEPTPALFVEHLVEVFDHVRRVLRKDGILFVNLGDSYASDPAKGYGSPQPKNPKAGDSRARTADLPAKNLCLVPERFALAMQDRGWWVRAQIVWHKPNGLSGPWPERPASNHELIYQFSRSANCFWDDYAVMEPCADATRSQLNRLYHGNGQKDYAGNGVQNPSDVKRRAVASLEAKNGMRRIRTVWSVNTQGFDGKSLGVEDAEHFAAWPEELVRRMVLAGTSEHGGCAACGAPWRRLTEKEKTPRGDCFGRGGQAVDEFNHGQAGSLYLHVVAVKTLGWEPTCKCRDPRDPLPQAVLDCFAGTGTTGAVAIRHGRRAILCEQGDHYLPLIRARCRAEEGLFTGPVLAQTEPETVRQLTLLEAGR